MMVLDASAVVELLLQTPAAAPLSERIIVDASDLHAPELLDVEVAHVLRRLCGRKELGENRALEALEDLRDLPLIRHSHGLLIGRAWELKENLSIYDGVYLALAELVEVPLLTRDRRIRDAPGHLAQVQVLP